MSPEPAPKPVPAPVFDPKNPEPIVTYWNQPVSALAQLDKPSVVTRFSVSWR